MGESIWLSKEIFAKSLELLGLDNDPHHVDDLYSFATSTLPSIRKLDELELGETEPFIPSPEKLIHS